MKRGRPPLPKKHRKGSALTLRLTDAEQQRIAKEAAAKKISTSDFVRSLISGIAPTKQVQHSRGGRTVLQFGQGNDRMVIDTPDELSRENWMFLTRYVETVLAPPAKE